MIKDEYNVIGVMSGTSLDGMDLVYAQFKLEDTWKFNILCSETIAYSDFWVSNLKTLVDKTYDALRQLDMTYTEYLAQTIKTFIKVNAIDRLDAICSHGHTALHTPKKGLTYQIGNAPIISKLLEHIVVCDFRVQDVALGGQGAPLVPIGDKLLFSEYDFCLNLGGFANISSEFKDERIAYDICPVNIVLNHYTNMLGFPYDNKGEMALSGTINIDLLSKLNQLNFYREPYPKSLGLEWVKSKVIPLIDNFKLEIKDILCTYAEHIAIQISKEINKKRDALVFVTGGGAYNVYLIKRINYHSKNKIIIPDRQVVEFKEALIFAFLGILKLRDEVNCLKSVTGAKKNHSSGVIFIP